MTATVTGIETVYAGTLFRSRLEAKWAAFMTALGWDWTYEPFDAKGYIPDFAVSGQMPLLIEVKPAIGIGAMSEYVPRIERAIEGCWDHDVLVVGVSPLLPSKDAWDRRDRAGGLMGERCWGVDGDDGWGWDEALWLSCRSEHKDHLGVALAHSVLSYAGRPCGFYDGNVHLEPVDGAFLAEAWAQATNATRWTKKAK